MMHARVFKASPASLRASAKQREAWIVSSLGSSQMTRARYCSRKSRKNDFRSLGGAMGLPWASKPVFCAWSGVAGAAVAGAPMGGAAGPAAGGE
jgi:hypothetical protein